jgi:2-polyprenyl-3-methyl-5-hydroxy-6-metoxy-1,4-benzoquinol methylase
MSDDSILPFTGERFTPECVREIAYEHWHRYAFALTLTKGRRVLDAACGEGFGASLLANAAEEVLAVDIDAPSVEHAKHRYAHQKNLHFLQADVTALDDLPAASFDVIISYETLEHVQAHERLLAGFVRLLKADGVLLISTPDKKNYTDATGVINPHHVRELYAEEFKSLIDQYFKYKKIYTQKLLFQSTLYCANGQDRFEAYIDNADGFDFGLNYPPMYYVAACAKSAEVLANLPDLSLYGDASESVYAHYNQEVRYGIWARERIAQLEAQLNESSTK